MTIPRLEVGIRALTALAVEDKEQAMRTFKTVRERLRIARGRLRECEGRLHKLEGQLATLRGRAEQARGRTRLRLLQAERQIRRTLDATVKRIDDVTHALEPRVRRAGERAEALRRGIQAGIKASAATYRRPGRN